LSGAAADGSSLHIDDVQRAGRVYLRLLRYAKPYWRLYLIGILGMGMYAITDFFWALYTQQFIHNAQPATLNPRILKLLPFGVIAIFIVRGVGDYLGSYYPARVSRLVIKVIRGDLFAHYLRLPTARYDRESTGAMLTRLIYQAELVASAGTDSLTTIIRDSLTICVDIGIMFYYSWNLALVGLVAAPAIAWLIRNVNIRFRRYSTRIQNSMGDVTRVAKEALDAHRVVKVFNAQTHIDGLFDQANEQNRRSNMRLISARSSSNPTVQMIAGFALAGVLFIAFREIAAGKLTLEHFAPFVVAMTGVVQPLRRLLNVAGPLQQGIAAGASVFEMLDAPGEPAGGSRALGRARGEVEFRDVSFEYASDKGVVLHHIDLRVGVGQTVAIVGRSGSGKSTLVSLLPRFYDPTAGQVLIDGVDIREYRIADLRRQLSLVSQDVVLFNDSVRNNILFGLTDVTQERLQAAADAAYVTEFIEQLPQRWETLVGDRGLLLSGGQRQRIAIARALLRDSPILILDEATSSLDTAAERHIQAALDQLVRNRTTFVIAHRLSTVERADRILVMSDGAIVERGTHAQLLSSRGAYADLHALQFSA
jgi:ATP-binding cassette, subfamily B, bacterial MsbA